ncbi:hypothetical protein J6590_033128 [Homalodisca vitripennis]|nr:hypothetical protein J6590_033128 [Homalodisca vitripennis]
MRLRLREQLEEENHFVVFVFVQLRGRHRLDSIVLLSLSAAGGKAWRVNSINTEHPPPPPTTPFSPQHSILPTPAHFKNPSNALRGKHGNLKLKHGSSDTSFERAHIVELNAANRISKGLSNQKWRVVLGTHCEVHYALPFLTGSSYSDAVGGVSLY